MNAHQRHLEPQCGVCTSVREKLSCEVYLSTRSVGCSRLPSAVNDPATTNLKMSSTNFDSTATMRYWKKKKTNATFGIGKRDWFLSFFSRYSVETVHEGDCWCEV